VDKKFFEVDTHPIKSGRGNSEIKKFNRLKDPGIESRDVGRLTAEMS
jgi:hypothetical protein